MGLLSRLRSWYSSGGENDREPKRTTYDPSTPGPHMAVAGENKEYPGASLYAHKEDSTTYAVRLWDSQNSFVGKGNGVTGAIEDAIQQLYLDEPRKRVKGGYKKMDGIDIALLHTDSGDMRAVYYFSNGSNPRAIGDGETVAEALQAVIDEIEI